METTRPSSPSQSTQAAHGTAPAKNRVAVAQGVVPAGDFLGLLTALGDNLLTSTSITDAGNGLTSDALLSNLPVLDTTQAGLDSSVMASLLAFQGGLSGAALGPLNTPSVATAADTTSLGGSQALLATGVNAFATGSRSVAVASSGGELGLVAQTAALDGATEVQADQGLGAAVKKMTVTPHLAGANTDALAARSTLSLRQEPLERSVSQAALVSALQAAVGGGDAPRDLSATGAGLQPQSAWGGTPASFVQPSVGLVGQEIGLGSSGQNAGRGGEGGRGASGQDRDAGALFGVDGLVAERPTVGDAPVFDGASALPTEDAVAEQVSYWVNQNIQNAELTVEHEGHPVEVTVSLSGNEAHVSFRSDQNETRALLDASVSQLRDLLEGQGLSLSGMTVSDASTQGSGNSSNEGQRQGGRGVRQTSVQASTATDAPLRRVSTVTDKAVDIFV